MALLKLPALLLFVSLSLFAQADVQHEKELNIHKLASGITIPWGMAVVDNEKLLITQREGYLYILDLASNDLTEVAGLPDDIRVEGQGGLFDIQLSPDFDKTNLVYFTYNKNVDGLGATTLSRAKLDGNQLIDWQDLIVTESRTNNKVHYGGRITFDGNGHVFLSIGDRGERDNAQNLRNHAGSILRLNLDGSIPADNPFVGVSDIRPEIWSYGHRNPQGLFYNPDSNQLWAVEHGPRGGDEINLISPGHNYGWPVISYGKEYWAPLDVGEGTHKEGMDQPVKVYVPSIATSSLIQYRGNLFSGWKGKLLVGALKQQHLNVVSLDSKGKASDEEKLLRSLNARIRNVIEAADGSLFIATDAGAIYRITPEPED